MTNWEGIASVVQVLVPVDDVLVEFVTLDTSPKAIFEEAQRSERSEARCVSSCHDPAPNTGRRMAGLVGILGKRWFAVREYGIRPEGSTQVFWDRQ